MPSHQTQPVWREDLGFDDAGVGASSLPSPAPQEPQPTPVWDLPLRIFHWALAATVLTALITGTIGASLMPVHAKAGQVALALVVFRVVWGFVGTTYARFTIFFPWPAQLKAYLTGQWQGLGHNPLGAMSVLALLTVLLAQGVAGLFANDDIAFTGPLYAWVSDTVSGALTRWHHRGATVLWVLIGLHLAAIVFYRVFKKKNLVKPMITGRVLAVQAEAHSTVKPWGLALALLLAGLALWVSAGAPPWGGV